jgi:hypothetical protein
MKKKLKKAAMAGAALYGASKLMGARKKSLLAATEDNKDASSMITGGTNLNDYNMSNSLKKKTLMEKAKDILKKRVDIPKGIFDPKGGQKTPYNMSVSDQDSIYEMGAGGAKYGKMIKANKGAMVMAKCKMGRNKATKIT